MNEEPKHNTKQIQVRVDDETHRRLRVLAASKSVTVQAMMQTAVQKILDQEER